MRYFIFILSLISLHAHAQYAGKFEQLDQQLPTPNSFRSASGAPGVNYWQQQADYSIDVSLNTATHQLTGKEIITYFNRSPETLRYIWLQLDQNNLSPKSLTDLTTTNRMVDSIPTKFFPLAKMVDGYKGGFNIRAVTDAQGKALPFVINYTMMRIDLPQPLATNQSFSFQVAWDYIEKDRMQYDERGGYEYFPEDGNYLYGFAQWFPRVCVFDDYAGWQNKQFLGRGEFALVFGNYQVNITLPNDFVVAATGVLQNPTTVLTQAQQDRLQQAKQSFDKPVFIITEEEATRNEKSRSTQNATWKFSATNVRDFAFAASRKFIWDAMAVKLVTTTPLAQSFYPKEGNPLWTQESTKAIKNALEVYSARTFDFPYPTAISVNCAEQGMEYPMICFNGGRPGKDKKISPQLLSRTVSVIVHEVGHNFFPMIVNSDERQCTWMDEGLNSFLEKETIEERYPDMEYGQNTPASIAAYMKGKNPSMRPIMANSDTQGRNFGNNGYSKPSAALTVLREVVMGKELFDKAFKEYANRWAFKHPKPADFFRTMEDASAVDLDWFWRGWFYTTDNVEVDLSRVTWFKVKSPDTKLENKNVQVTPSTNIPGFEKGPAYVSVIPTPDKLYGEFANRLDDKKLVKNLAAKNMYELTFKNNGGLVSPLVIEWTYTDGTQERETIPAEIWRLNENEVTKIFIKEKEVKKIDIDPDKKTADVNTSNNMFPRTGVTSRFDEFKKEKGK